MGGGIIKGGRTKGIRRRSRRRKGVLVWTLTSEQLLDVLAGVRGGELVDDVQRRLVVGVPDVHVHSGLQGQLGLLPADVSVALTTTRVATVKKKISLKRFSFCDVREQDQDKSL